MHGIGKSPAIANDVSVDENCNVFAQRRLVIKHIAAGLRHLRQRLDLLGPDLGGAGPETAVGGEELRGDRDVGGIWHV